MKKLLLTLFVAFCSFLTAETALAQTACTDCPPGTMVSTPVVTNNSLILDNQAIPGYGSCLYRIYVSYDSNRCDGVLQLNVNHYMIQPINCPTPYVGNCSLDKLAIFKLITLHFNEPILFNTNWDCCTTVEVDLQGNNCFSNPSTPHSGAIGYLNISCGSIGCCKALFTPIGGGLVQYTVFQSTSSVCPNMATSIPTTVILYCEGVPTTFNIIQQPYYCYQGCILGTGVFKTDLEAGLIEAIDGSAQVKVYPNPVSDQLNLTFTEGSADNSVVEVYNLQGQQILQKNIPQSGGQDVNIGLSEVSAGTYIIRISSNNNVIHNQTFEVVK